MSGRGTVLRVTVIPLVSDCATHLVHPFNSVFGDLSCICMLLFQYAVVGNYTGLVIDLIDMVSIGLGVGLMVWS